MDHSPPRPSKVRLSTKGQLVLPRAVRERQGWHAGTELLVTETPGGVLVRGVEAPRSATLDDLIGCVGYSGPAVSLAAMDAAVAREARRRSGPPRSRRARKAAA